MLSSVAIFFGVKKGLSTGSMVFSSITPMMARIICTVGALYKLR